jgi:hypothetical protein
MGIEDQLITFLPDYTVLLGNADVGIRTYAAIEEKLLLIPMAHHLTVY